MRRAVDTDAAPRPIGPYSQAIEADGVVFCAGQIASPPQCSQIRAGGSMWNRHGALLTISDCFQPTLAALTKLATRGVMWADCEALEDGTTSDAARSSCLKQFPNPAYRLTWSDARCSNHCSCAMPSTPRGERAVGGGTRADGAAA